MAGELFTNHDHELVDPSLNAGFDTGLVVLVSNSKGREEPVCGELFQSVCVPRTSVPPAVRNDDGGGMANDASMGYTADAMAAAGNATLFPPSGGHPAGRPTPLPVPTEFSQVAYNWMEPSAAAIASQVATPMQLDMLEICLKQFASSLVNGIQVQMELNDKEDALDASVRSTDSALVFPSISGSMMSSIMSRRSPDGTGLSGSTANGKRLLEAVITATPDLSVLVISAGQVERSVPLRAVRSVRPGKEAAAGSWRSWFGSENSCIVVLRLTGGRHARLRFDQADQAAYFGTCMRVLVKASRSISTSSFPEAAR